MKKIIRFCSRAKWIGLLGVPTLIWEFPIFKLFWLFWLFGLVEIVLDFPIFIQNLQLVAGMVTVPLLYGKSMPSKDNIPTDITFSLPLAGGWVVVNGGVDREFSHSWEVPTQRYAYDFIQLDADARSFCGEPTDVHSYHCYGKDILAPADGIVVEVLNNQPDSIILRNGAVDCSARDARGNYLLIKHAEHLYSLMAHLKKDSVCVRRGEHVTRGQKIAACGNSGNSSEPHLHFQLQSGRSFSFSAGIPIRFDRIAAEHFAGYDRYDPRPTISDLPNPTFINRGQLVSNANL